MKVVLIIASCIVLLVGLGMIVLAHPAFGVYRHVSKHKIHSSPNYRDGMFQNQEPTPLFTGDIGRKSKDSLMKIWWRFLTNRDSLRVPLEPIPALKTDLKNLPTDTDWLVWFGHSSYLFCLNGKRFLVDPLLRPEWPSSMMLKAFEGIDIYRPEDMPDIDILIITHEHWDHMDYATLRDLRDRVKKVVCPLGIADYLRYWNYSEDQIVEMDWYESHTAKRSYSETVLQCNGPTAENREALIVPLGKEGGQTITCLPSRHFSNRLFGRNQTLWASFMIEAAGRKVYIGGDGGYDKRFKQIHERFGTIDLAFLENGQYNTNWKHIHTMPEDLEKVVLDLQANQVFTVHHDKYSLAMHPWFEPDSIAHKIAALHNIRLLDAPIGKVVNF